MVRRSLAPALAVLFVAALMSVSGPLAADANPSAAEAAAADALVMSADQVDLDVEAKTALFTGHVELRKGAVVVRCSRVDARYDHVPHVTWAKGTGGVVADVKGVKAEAPEVELDVAGHVLELRGGVRLMRGDGWITADRATIHLDTSKVSMVGVKGSIPIPIDATGALRPTPPP